MNHRKPMGELLCDLGVVTPEQLQLALKEQSQTGEKLGQVLVNKGWLTEQQLIEALEFMLGIPHIKIGSTNIDTEVIKSIPHNLIKLHKILPISQKGNSITLAMADPLNQQAIDDVTMASGLDVIPVLASENELDTAIRQYLAFKLDPNMEKILGELNLESKRELLLNRDRAVKVDDDAPIVRMVNSIISQAVQGRCSDIHIEPQSEATRIRFRVDGDLFEVLTLPKNSTPAIVSRFKIMAGMDIAEKRIPQDGRFQMKIENREVDFRVATLPITYGEKVVLRILDQRNAINRLDYLGLLPHNQQLLVSLSQRPHGMLVITGPTGSGKTTTLYSILNEINATNKNIITLEDPIEYSISGINQVQINPKAGLTFPSGLRSILRQDPDVIMVGEIRDFETAQLSIQAALTGHLVLSTLHTNSASATIARLSDMGIEDFLLASALTGVVSQRLVRRLCSNCSKPYVLDEGTAVRLGIPHESGNRFYRAEGCNMCRHLGYQGRIALHEILSPGYEIKELISSAQHSEETIQATAVQAGMITITEDGISKAKQGLTSLEEVMKAVLLGG